MAQKDKDALTGTETTGHEWDGIKELNTPLPKWWVYTFYVTILWAIGYWVVYPAWPSLSDYTKGYIGYSSRSELHNQMASVQEARAPWMGRFEMASVEQIAADDELLRYANAGGRAIFNDNCAPCHGAGGQGTPGYPVLADDDWIWGGTPSAIEATIRYGVRSTHDETRYNEMPAYGRDGLLTTQDIDAVATYVVEGAVASPQGAVVFQEQCAACHGEDGRGLQELGGPNLTDAIWLYGGGKDGVLAQINTPKHGVMTPWVGRLDDASIKQVAVYVHSLGGGQ